MCRLLLSLALFAGSLVAALASGPPAAARDCRQSALERLQAAAPEGFAIYKQISDKSFFLGWIDCGEAQLGLPTAVHESVHHITAETDAFPLIGGGQIRRPHEVSAFFPPSSIAARFKADDFVATYLRPGAASSSTDFLYLLDELNAYTHDINTAVRLHRADRAVDTGGAQVAHRDGLAALMAFVALYVERAEASEPATWAGLRQPRVAKTVAALWGSAENVIAASCGIADFGVEDEPLIRRVCQAKPAAALQKVIGRAPVCPSACLQSVSVATRERKPFVDATPTGSLR